MLLPLLERAGVDEVVMESRFPAADAKDAALFRTMLKREIISEIQLTFADPAIEHRLWVPDQILGAYADENAGAKAAQAWAREWGHLRESITTVSVLP